MNKKWLQERKKDIFVKLAKEKGFRSRAAFKLLHIQKKYNIIKKGDIIIDLGAAPGGISQAASRLTGDKGLVISIDIKPIEPFKEKNIVILQKDIYDPYLVKEIFKITNGKKADVIISDTSPHLSGVREIDIAKQLDLAYRCLEIANDLLKKNGFFIIKLFESSEVKEFEKNISKKYKIIKKEITPATRKGSSEYFLITSKNF
ncbi:MAG: RlmE family RNA methyltransferase [Nitrososphaerota archaeon]